MDNKYEVINTEQLNDNTLLFTIIDNHSKDYYSCILEKQKNKKAKVLVDDLANIYDIGEALFQYDLDLFPILPLYMITKDMERDYENYHPGKSNSSFKTDEDFYEAYYLEEKRITKLRKNNKQLVK